MTTFAGGLTPAQFYAGLNRLQKEYNVEDYGAVHNGTTDDTAAIQAAIDACNSGGGGIIFFPKGVYVIGGALRVTTGGTSYNSQIIIPFVLSTSQLRYTFHFMGEVSPEFCGTTGTAPAGVTPDTASTGVVLKSTITGSGTNPSVICGGNFTGADVWNTGNAHTIIIENISIQPVYDGSFKLTMGALNFRGCYNAIVKNVTAFPFNADLNDSTIPSAGVVGIALPFTWCDLMNKIENCHVGGFYDGYLIGEHTTVDHAIAICCVNGFTFSTNNFPNLIQRIGAYWCINTLKFITAASMNMIQCLTVEWYIQTKWYDNQYIVLDVSNYGRGELHYDICEYSVGLNNAKFNKSGGTALQCMPISFVNGATGFTVTGADDAAKLASLIAILEAKGIIIDGTT